MTTPVGVDRRSARRQATRDEIVAAAWDLAREHGLTGLALRDLARRVGMKAPSLYSYFASKAEIYDAMFHDGSLAFLAALEEAGGLDDEGDARALARDGARRFFAFCVEDPVRYQLLFQRTIPGFEPSEGSYAIAVDAYRRTTEELARLGVTDPAGVDLWTAVLSGLVDQQLANDPGGDRWERLVDRAVDMLLREIVTDPVTTPDRTTTRG
jgi:AcrR family transcriptional regulator